MRYPVLFLALPFLSVAQDINWDSCAYGCLNNDNLSKCSPDPSCICTLDEGNYFPELLICLQQNCTAFVTQYKQQLENLCTLQDAPITGIYGNTTTTVSPTSGGNKTVSLTKHHSTVTKTTFLPSKTTTENVTITKSPTEVKPSTPTSPAPTSSAAAVILEGAIGWHLAIVLGLAGVAAL